MSKKDNKTHVVLVVDRSGSMSSIQRDTIGGINTFLDKYRETPDNLRVTYIQFDDRYDIVYDNVEIKFVPEITNKTFVPRGMTALLDAIGKTVNHISTQLALASDEDTRIVVVIVTDGHENRSREFTRGAIHELITDKQANHDWQFVFLAANQDAIATAQQYGFKGGTAMNYTAGKVGVARSFAAVASHTHDYTRGVTNSVADFSAYERVCATGDSVSAQDAALQQLASATGQSFEDLKKQASTGGK